MSSEWVHLRHGEQRLDACYGPGPGDNRDDPARL